MRVAWLTDIHLNFLDAAGRDAFAREVAAHDAQVVLITGDIAEAPTLAPFLDRLSAIVDAPILYVLGNHDFYRSRVETVRAQCRARDHQTLVYLHGRAPYRLTDDTGVVGVDGWADGGFGRPRDSDLVFTDWYLIEDFREVDAVTDVEARLEMVASLARECAERLREALEQAVARFRRVLVLTHVPPFERSAGHNGSAMGELWVPWLACRATGEVLLEFANACPEVHFEVLCGHTHMERTNTIAPNLVTRTGGAVYRAPTVQRVWEL